MWAGWSLPRCGACKSHPLPVHMDKLETDIRRGEQARQLLADPLIGEARDHIEAELWRLFKDATPQDQETLQFVKAMQYFHSKYFAHFERIVTSGKIAQINLEAKKKSLKERIFG